MRPVFEALRANTRLLELVCFDNFVSKEFAHDVVYPCVRDHPALRFFEIVDDRFCEREEGDEAQAPHPGLQAAVQCVDECAFMLECEAREAHRLEVGDAESSDADSD